MDFLTAHGPALLFYLFAGIALLSAILVVVQRNPMYGAIALLVSFLSVAVLFLLRHAEFLAIVQIFVYGGGIMVLFLFVIMLVNVHRLKETSMFQVSAPIAIIVAIALAAIFGFLFTQVELPAGFTSPERLTSVEGAIAGNSEAVAWELYRTYLLPFEIVSVFLLVAMVGAVILGRRA